MYATNITAHYYSDNITNIMITLHLSTLVLPHVRTNWAILHCFLFKANCAKVDMDVLF